jgi:hypothetical protein
MSDPQTTKKDLILQAAREKTERRATITSRMF